MIATQKRGHVLISGPGAHVSNNRLPESNECSVLRELLAAKEPDNESTPRVYRSHDRTEEPGQGGRG